MADTIKKTPAKKSAGSKSKAKPEVELLYYVGIGASAGGLEALRPFVANLPASANMTYIIAQHMSPDHRSLMVELLARETQLVVEPAKHNLIPLANTIYVAPANTDVTIFKGKMCLSKPSNTIGPKPSVDRFFMSLAEDREDKSIAIILSGTGSDGAHGIKAIKAAGGITIAQDPISAKYDSMPNAAIRIGVADLVLSPQEIAVQLSSIIQRPRTSIADERMDIPLSSVRGIIHQIMTETGMDFTNYKDATLSRQITRRMMAKQIANLEEYGIFIKKNPQELRDLAGNFLICVTSFFRDPEAFEALRKAIRDMLEKKQPREEIRIWIPGCATGEEVYSIAILLIEELGEKINQHQIQIFATDINTDAVHTARAGIYPEAALSEVPDALIKKYFTIENGMYRIDKELKAMVLFARHDLVQDPPFVKIDLISCRNLLIYFKPDLQDRIMKIFHYALRPDCVLFLGKSESVGKQTALLVEIDRKNKLFIKRPSSTPHILTFPRNRPNLGIANQSPVNDRAAHSTSPHTIGADRLFNIYTPPSLLITNEGEILEIYGDCSGFLAIRKGKADFSIYTLIATEFRAALRASVHRVARSKDNVYGSPVKLSVGGQEGLYRIAVHNAGGIDKADSDLILVSFEKMPEPVIRGDGADSTDLSSNERISELEQELLLNRENLQSVIEELETANEELQSLNEEAQAANEELQASNEELETANEELQASNEELITVNDELNSRTIELGKTTDELTNVMNSLLKGLLLVDANLNVLRFNKIAHHYFDLHPGIPSNLATLACHYDIPDFLKHVQLVLRHGQLAEYEFHKGNEEFFMMRMSPYIDSNVKAGVINGVVIAVYNITEKKLADEKLKLSASVFEHASEATVITDEINRIISVNPAFTSITGYTPEDVIGKNPKILSSGKHGPEFYHQMWMSLMTRGAWEGEVQNKRKNGELYNEFLSINVLKEEGKVFRHIAVFSDITDSKKAQETIARQANFDSLTGLPNRQLIGDRLNQMLLHSRRSGKGFAVFFVDLDNFKTINDALGHAAGDELLGKMAERIHSVVREVDTVGRLGGDEFIVLLDDVTSSDDVVLIANKILVEAHKPIAVSGNSVQTAASIGITMYPMDGSDAEALMRNADSAMYEAKKRGRNTFCFFTQNMQEKAIRHQWLEGELALSLLRGQINIYYQPIINITTMEISGAEALMRWEHPTQGFIPPDIFIPIAEQNGMINKLSEKLFDTALAEISQLQNNFKSGHRIALNLSVAEFVSLEHINKLIAQLETNELVKANLVTLELTESIKLTDNNEYRDFLSRFKNSGCKIAIDDFGTGYSSLSYLKRIQVDILKVDRTFVRDITTDASDAEMIKAILQMAKAFDLETVAEGVETEEQLDFIKRHGCKYAQGYLFSKPLPYKEYINFVESFNARLVN